ncbi:putative cytochrome P450 CYP44 [Babylonia areolata]|uniref:putative cytochrome P450 CYP44 n=1 Tax=Babylonia areolata TaxID=304850 RepID=UPI003FD26939
MSSGGQIILHNNIVLSNYLVPAGVPIELNSRRTAKNAVWFDHPNFYVPERWMGEKSEKIPSLAFMPFGFIDHGCMGLRSFFFQEQSAALIKILQMYKVDLPEEFQKGQLQTMHAPFRTPREPLPFVFTPRASKSKKKGK